MAGTKTTTKPLEKLAQDHCLNKHIDSVFPPSATSTIIPKTSLGVTNSAHTSTSLAFADNYGLLDSSLKHRPRASKLNQNGVFNTIHLTDKDVQFSSGRERREHVSRSLGFENQGARVQSRAASRNSKKFNDESLRCDDDWGITGHKQDRNVLSNLALSDQRARDPLNDENQDELVGSI